MFLLTGFQLYLEASYNLTNSPHGPSHCIISVVMESVMSSVDLQVLFKGLHIAQP